MDSSIEMQKLVGKWLHSHEEDTPDTMVFRPVTHSFPPSRGRRGFELRPDGTMVDQAIAPDDRRSSRQGTWQLTGNNQLQLQPVDAGSSTMQVVQATQDKLVVRR
jgi:hypothetical protein